jgi:flagellar secretion chaperone FliS
MRDAFQRYQEIQVETANRGKLLIMLYQGCIKFLRLARKSIDEKDLEGANHYLIRSQNIVNELRSTLDLEKGGKIAENLDKLYDFMLVQLIEANIKKDGEMIQIVEKLMLDLLDAWQEIIEGQETEYRPVRANG